MSDDSTKEDDSGKDDDLSEDGFSSEDLLRDAKEKFGLDDGSSGVADSLLESSMGESSDESDERVPSIEEIAAELAATSETDFATTPDTDFSVTPDTDFAPGGTEDLLHHSAEGPEAPTYRPPTTSDVTPEEVAAAREDSLEPDSIQFRVPDPGVPTGLPSEPVEVDSDQVIAGLPVPAETSAKAGGLLSTLWRNRWIVVVAVIGVSVLAGILDKSEPISNRSAGDCFDEPSGETVTEITPVDCAKDHELEVFATISLGGGTFPGDQAVVEQAFDSCLNRFEAYVGEPYETSILYIFPFTPTEGAWNDGEREALCIVYEPVPGSDGATIKPRTGSVRGSGL